MGNYHIKKYGSTNNHIKFNGHFLNSERYYVRYKTIQQLIVRKIFLQNKCFYSLSD